MRLDKYPGGDRCGKSEFGKRTYDAKVDSTFKDGFYKNLYVIYEVPNGCTEYSLQIGSNEKTAYCHVKIKQ